MKKYYLFWYDYEGADMMTLDEIEEWIMKPEYGPMKKQPKKQRVLVFNRIKRLCTDEDAYVKFTDIKSLLE